MLEEVARTFLSPNPRSYCTGRWYFVCCTGFGNFDIANILFTLKLKKVWQTTWYVSHLQKSNIFKNDRLRPQPHWCVSIIRKRIVFDTFFTSRPRCHDRKRRHSFLETETFENASIHFNVVARKRNFSKTLSSWWCKSNKIFEVNNFFSSRNVQKCYLQSTLSHVEWSSYISYNGKLHLFHVYNTKRLHAFFIRTIL